MYPWKNPGNRKLFWLLDVCNPLKKDPEVTRWKIKGFSWFFKIWFLKLKKKINKKVNFEEYKRRMSRMFAPNSKNGKRSWLFNFYLTKKN